VKVLRTATCRCGQLSVECTGEPVRISVCHCYDCQKRSGSAFAAQAFFPADAFTAIGEHRTYLHVSDSGGLTDFHFCPNCGLSLWFQRHLNRERVGIALGNFCDRNFPAPSFSIYESRKHAWVEIVGEGIEHDR
jgi:hypothetical protein